ncbi:hypothetical protein ZWY2020_028332 [Hordeum vulgare]|nr:hypothetical protein ZWY2020_028332 [Hordeum vulgare]
MMARLLLGVSLLLLVGLRLGRAATAVASEPSVSDDMRALLAFKRAISDDPLSDWNSSDADPCWWSGVWCSFSSWNSSDSRVVALDLSNSSLSGFLAPEIGSLTSLQKLILDHNAFTGSIPREIGKLKNLTVLNLGANQLVGPIPSETGDMKNISTIDLHANRLSGAIPPELGKLANLKELRLSNNNLTGTIPGSNDSVMVSTNKEDGVGLCQSRMAGNCFQNNGTMNRPDWQCGNSTDAGKDNNSIGKDGQQKSKLQPLWLLIVEVVTGVSVLTVLTLCVIAGIRRRKDRSSRRNGVPWTRALSWKENNVISIDDDLLANVPKITRQELAEACEDFSNIIGSSHETVVYKGTMKDGREIAVVSMSAPAHYWTNYVELYFQKEVVEMARLGHENAAKMVGYCKSSDPFSRMVVFEYPPNGTLYEHLHEVEGYQLSWPRRMKIALSIARVLRYLHTELQPPFAVAALASSSIYLTEDFSPKIIDFERWRGLVGKPLLSSGCVVNGGGHSNGVVDSRHVRFMDVQANTFAFGVILLELISGRASLQGHRRPGGLGNYLARKHLEQPGELGKLVDPKLAGSVNQESLGIICNVVNLCIDAEPSRRPSMNMIAAILEDGVDTSVRDSSLAWAEAAIS